MTTALQIAEKAIEIADQNPDFVYEAPTMEEGGNMFNDCVYVLNGKGHCLFGQAIMDLGVVDADYLATNDGWRIGGLVSTMASDGYLDDEGSSDLKGVMTGAQIAQDNGVPWADAVAELREHLGSVKA